MGTEKIEFNLLGPFDLDKDSTQNLLYQKSFNNPGIYFWTIKTNGQFLINYIGISSKSLKERFFQHIKSYLIGNYDIYNVNDLQKFKINKIYEPQEDFQKYFLNIENYFQAFIKNVKLFRFFFAPLYNSRMILELVESHCIWCIKNNDETREFLSNYRLSRLKTEDLNIEVKIHTESKNKGLPTKFIL